MDMLVNLLMCLDTDFKNRKTLFFSVLDGGWTPLSVHLYITDEETEVLKDGYRNGYRSRAQGFTVALGWTGFELPTLYKTFFLKNLLEVTLSSQSNSETSQYILPVGDSSNNEIQKSLLLLHCFP